MFVMQFVFIKDQILLGVKIFLFSFNKEATLLWRQRFHSLPLVMFHRITSLSMRTNCLKLPWELYILVEFFVPGIIYVKIHRLCFFFQMIFFKNASEHTAQRCIWNSKFCASWRFYNVPSTFYNTLYFIN